MDIKELGMTEEVGGSKLVILGTIIAITEYKNKAGSMVYQTVVMFHGGNMKLATQPGHPIRQMGVGEKVLLSQTFADTGFGWGPLGDCQLLEFKPQKKTPSAS